MQANTHFPSKGKYLSRNCNFDLLRIISTYAIIGVHTLGGEWIQKTLYFNLIPIFILITGFFSCANNKISTFKIFIQIVFTFILCLVLNIIMWLITKKQINIDDIKHFFSMGGEGYGWYLWSLLIISPVFPLVNLLIANIKNATHSLCLIVFLYTIFYVLSLNEIWFWTVPLFTSLLLITLYSFGCWLSYNMKKNKKIFIACVSVLLIQLILKLTYVDDIIKWCPLLYVLVIKTYYWEFPHDVGIAIFSIGIFYLFLYVKIDNTLWKKIISFWAKATLYIYIYRKVLLLISLSEFYHKALWTIIFILLLFSF